MAGRSTNNSKSNLAAPRPVFPFTAIVGQEEMKLALLLSVVAPSVGGVLVMGHRGTGKSTAVRALADLLPPLMCVRGCAYNCDPADSSSLCDDCRALQQSGERLARARRSVPVVELPLGGTEDRVCGTIDLARALRDGVKAFEPGLLARANRGFLYIDEVNLLEDHLVDLLLDVAATGRNRVEREGVSAEHPARFVLVGSGNPEEGELRPQLLDRFGLCAEVETVRDLDERVRIVEHREAFDDDPEGFLAAREAEQARLRRRVLCASRTHAAVEVPRELLRSVAELCLRLGVDGHRGEITITRAARALAAFEGRRRATVEDVRRVAAMSLRHRLRRDPLEPSGGDARVRNCVKEIFGDSSNAQDGAGQKSRPRGGRGPDADDSGRGPEAGASGRGPEAGASGRDPDAGDSPGRRDGGRSGDFDSGTAVGAGFGKAGDVDLSRVDAEDGEQVIPAAEVGLKQDAFDGLAEAVGSAEVSRRARQSSSASGRRVIARRSTPAARGRYSASSAESKGARAVALDATLRAAAHARAFGRRKATCGASASIDGAADSAFVARREPGFKPEELRFKLYSAKAGTLYVFLLDASGSMAANRIGQAKGALAQLLRRSYVNRDRVSLVSFRGRGAELLLAPSASASRARRLLEEMAVGGSTPLAAGLLRALGVTRRAASEGARRVRLIVFTDGRANVALAESLTASGTNGGAALDGHDGSAPGLQGDAKLKTPRGAALKEQIRDEIRRLGASLRAEGVSSLVVDTRGRFTSNGEGRFLSEALGGRYVQLPQLISESALTEVLRDAEV
jgi:magnesium chelatase ATPase subunit I